jgi:hypothetical protein
VKLRGSDAFKEREGQHSVVGFNPFSRRVFYGSRSRLARWLREPRASARRLNARDHLLHEVLFAVHDYLHVWAYLAIDALEPGLGLGTAPITAERFEDLMFGHILSEAVATAGLDYWYLSTISLDDVVPLGSAMRRPLTVDFHERDAAELRRHNPTLDVQSPAFLGVLTRLYGEGVIEGFAPADLDRSPILSRWLEHELSYSRVQRAGIREWLRYLAGDARLGPADAAAPIDLRPAWRRRLTERLSALLWEKVHDDVVHLFPRRRASPWRSPASRPTHYRYLNERVVPFDPRRTAAGSFRWFAWQRLSSFELASVPRAGLRLVDVVIDREDPELVDFIVRGARRVPAVRGEIRDLFMPN